MRPFSFSAHVALLDELLARRPAIVEEIERRLLNVKDKDVSRSRDRRALDAAFATCIFDGLPREMSALNGALAAARSADGLEPLFRQSSAHELNPADLLIRAYDHWERQRWPGARARLAYADRLYAVFILHQLEDLSLRIWDADGADADAALGTLQRLMDGVNAPAGSLVLLRDARWLLHTAQGPLTSRLDPYFAIADRIDASFTGATLVGIHAAGAKLAGGHLRSQRRHRMADLQRDAADPLVLAMTRNSNAMDLALLVRDLVPLLEAYKDACGAGPREERQDLADAIVQGCSADPELLLTRLDLLEPYTVIEDVFIRVEADRHLSHTPAGERHLATLASYVTLAGELAASLREDARALDPAERDYSPLGLTYGFCADLSSNIAAGVLYGANGTNASLDELFALADPEGPPQLSGQGLDVSAGWARLMFDDTMAALDARRSSGGLPNASRARSARLFVIPEGVSAEDLPAGFLPEPVTAAEEHCVTSDVTRALSNGMTAFPRSQITTDRGEGRFLASAEAGGKWCGISKVVLTLCTGQGQDAVLTDVPHGVCEVLRFTCGELAVVANEKGRA